jgi:hypothetical protein
MSRPLDQVEKGLTDLEYRLLLTLKEKRERAFTVDGLISEVGEPQSVSETEDDVRKRYRAALNSLIQRQMINIHFIANEKTSLLKANNKLNISIIRASYEHYVIADQSVGTDSPSRGLADNQTKWPNIALFQGETESPPSTEHSFMQFAHWGGSCHNLKL